MNVPQDRDDHAALNDRMGYLFGIRIAVAVVTLIGGAIRPEALGVPYSTVASVVVAYAAISIIFEAARRRSTRFNYSLLTVMLLVDGVFLASAMYVHRRDAEPAPLPRLPRTSSPCRCWRRTGPASRSRCGTRCCCSSSCTPRPPCSSRRSTSSPGAAIEFDRMPVLNVTSFWLFALATSVFSALNERELRQRRADLQAMVDVGARLDDASRSGRPVADRPRRPGRALRLRARRRPRRIRRPASSSSRPTASTDAPTTLGRPGRDRRRRLGATRARCRSSGSTRRRTRSSRGSCPTRATCSSRR